MRMSSKESAPTIDMTQVYQSFFLAMMHNDIHELTNALFSALQCPVMVSDDIANNLSQSPDHYIGDKDWDSVVRTKVSSSAIYSKFYKKYVQGASPNTEYPVYISDGEHENTPQLLSVLRKNGKFLGVSAILRESSDLTDDEREIIALFNDAASEIISRRGFKGARSKLAVIDLVTRKYDDIVLSEDTLSNLSLVYKPPYHVIIGKFVKEQDDEPLYKRVCSDINLIGDNTVAYMYHDHIIIFCHGMSGKTKQHVLEDVKEKCCAYDIAISISNQYDALGESNELYRQALLTMEAGRYYDPGQMVYESETYALRQVVLGFSKHYPVRVFVDPILSEIKEYDKENDSNYYESLWTYLICMTNIKAAAAKLFIHPNSMHYRINRISELFDIDFNDFDRLYSLLIYFLLDSTIEKRLQWETQEKS